MPVTEAVPRKGSAVGHPCGGAASRLCASVLGNGGGSPARPQIAHRLSVSRGRHRALTSRLLFPEFGSDTAVPPAKMASVLNSPLWKPVFRHQLSPELGLAASWPTPPHQDSKEVFTLAASFYLAWSPFADGCCFHYEPLCWRPHPHSAPSALKAGAIPCSCGVHTERPRGRRDMLLVLRKSGQVAE